MDLYLQFPFDHGNVNFGGFPIPQKFSDALLLSAHLQQKVEEQEAKIEEDKPKVEYYSGMVENRDYLLLRLSLRN